MTQAQTQTQADKRIGWDDKWKFYRDQGGLWSWVRHSKHNKKQVGRSCEGYVNFCDCEANATRNGFNRKNHDELHGTSETVEYNK